MRLFLFVLMATLFCGLNTAAQPALLLGPDLEPRAVTLRSLSSQAIQVFDRQGKTQDLSLDEVVRLTLIDGDASQQTDGRVVVRLRDGQVLSGELMLSNDEEAVRLKLDNDRAAQVPLDEILSLALQAQASAPAAEEDDALLLATGEVLLGFVETIDEGVVGFVVGDADDAIDIPLERIHAISIANKPKQAEVQPGTMRVTTTDGSVLYVQDAKLFQGKALTGVSSLPILPAERADDGVSAAAASRISLPMSRVLIIEPMGTRHTLTALSDVAWELVEGGEVFGVAMPPRVLAQGDLWLHAPTTLAYELPKGSARLALTVAMDLDDTIPETQRRQAGCELVVTLGDQVITRHTLAPDSPPKRLNLPLNSPDLRIALDPGVNGPVLDRVLIIKAELLVSE